MKLNKLADQDWFHGRLSHCPLADVGYSPELCLALRTFELPHCHSDEQTLCQQFDQVDQNRKWREGVIKSCFNYLLLDPRLVLRIAAITQITGSAHIHSGSKALVGNSCAETQLTSRNQCTWSLR